MFKQADVHWLVAPRIAQQKLTAKMVSDRTLRDGLHERECGVWWHKLRKKPIFIDDDIKERYA